MIALLLSAIAGMGPLRVEREMTDEVLIERVGRVLAITLNRPRVRNAERGDGARGRRRGGLARR